MPKMTERPSGQRRGYRKTWAAVRGRETAVDTGLGVNAALWRDLPGPMPPGLNRRKRRAWERWAFDCETQKLDAMQRARRIFLRNFYK